jgi:hypothetical protein
MQLVTLVKCIWLIYSSEITVYGNKMAQLNETGDARWSLAEMSSLLLTNTQCFYKLYQFHSICHSSVCCDTGACFWHLSYKLCQQCFDCFHFRANRNTPACLQCCAYFVININIFVKHMCHVSYRMTCKDRIWQSPCDLM